MGETRVPFVHSHGRLTKTRFTVSFSLDTAWVFSGYLPGDFYTFNIANFTQVKPDYDYFPKKL
jgi:hypothetical protein